MKKRANFHTSYFLHLTFLLVVSALLLVAAYQARPSYSVTIGSAVDSAVVDGFWEAERTPPDFDPGYKSFRWMRGYGVITLPDIGASDYRVELTVNAQRPPGQPAARLKIEVRGAALLDIEPQPTLGVYTFTVPANLVPDGTLTLNVTANPFSPPGDIRELGIIVTGITVSPEGGGPLLQLPPAGMWLAVLGTGLLIALLFAALGWGPGVVITGGALPAAFAAGLLIWDRLWLTSRGWYDAWLPVCALGVAFAALVLIAGGTILRRVGTAWTPAERRILVTIAFAAFVARLAGELHPLIFVFDLGYHANVLGLVEGGNYIFSTNPAEFGGAGSIAPSTFYLPTPYFFVIPLKWLFGGEEQMAIRLLLVSLGTLGTLPVFYLAKRFAGSGRAGLIAALLYVTLPVAVLPYSWGIMPNIFGEFVALAALTVMIGSEAGDLTPRRPAFWVMLALFTLALLSHSGVVFLFGATALAIIAIWLVRARSREARRSALVSLSAFAAATLVAYALYYHNFTGQMLASAATIADKGAGGEFSRFVGGSVKDDSLGLIQREVRSRSAWALGGIEGFWREAVAYYRAWPLLAALLGFLTFVQGSRFKVQGSRLLRAQPKRLNPQASVLARSALGWGLVVLLFAFVGWFFNVYVRYVLFALPIVSLGAGIFLAALWRRGGRLAQTLVGCTLVAFTLWALVLWGDRITFAFKG